jgi:protein SCO1
VRARWSIPALLVAWALIALPVPSARAQTEDEKNQERARLQLRGVDIDEHIGRQLPLDLPLTTSDGRTVRLGDYFAEGNTKPAIIGLVYYRCPQVCGIFMNEMAKMMKGVSFTPGEDYRVLLVSFDPRETPEMAAAAKETYFAPFERPATPTVREGWQYHTSGDAEVRALADAVGFKYRRMPDGNYSHPVCKFIITPDGKVSRYLYGYVQEPRDLKLALMEASQGRLVPTNMAERVMAFCYVFDPTLGKYTLRAVRVMQVGGVLTLAGLGTLLGVLFAGERLRRRARARAGLVLRVDPGTPPAMVR